MTTFSVSLSIVDCMQFPFYKDMVHILIVACMHGRSRFLQHVHTEATTTFEEE